jgi:hypothetical protein
MSKLTEQLGTVGIHNAWGFAGHGNAYIAYTPGDSGRGGRSANFSIPSPAKPSPLFRLKEVSEI